MKKQPILIRSLAWIAATALLIILVLQIGMVAAHTWKPYAPDYQKTDISSILDKSERTDEDYEILYRQTGLTKLGIDGLLAANRKSSVLKLQQDFFAERKEESDVFGPFICWEKYSKPVQMALLEDGDILVTASTHVSFIRFGHAALIVDGKNKKFLNAIGYGNLSSIENSDDFEVRSAFMILRPKADKSFRAEVAAYAKKNLTGAHYSLSVGILGKKYEEDFKRTHCSHLVWYAYKHFGIDVDSNGGALVTPKDIANSPELELVQVYGFDLDGLWK